MMQLAIEFAGWVRAYKPHENQDILWLKVFKEVNSDGSGLLTFDELRHVIRRLFKLGKSQCSEEKIKVLWCALDSDDSDTIQMIEFGRFIKLAKSKPAANADDGMETPRKSSPRRPMTASPRKEPIWKPGKSWNSFGWAPTSAETNYLGGPWSLRGQLEYKRLLAQRRAEHPPSTTGTPSRAYTSRPRKAELLPLVAAPTPPTQFRWPYEPKEPKAPSWRATLSRPGTANSSSFRAAALASRPGTAR